MKTVEFLFGQNKFMTIGQKSDFLYHYSTMGFSCKNGLQICHSRGTVTTNLQGFIYAVSSFKFSSLHHSGENDKFTKERLRDNSLNLQKTIRLGCFGQDRILS